MTIMSASVKTVHFTFLYLLLYLFDSTEKNYSKSSTLNPSSFSS